VSEPAPLAHDAKTALRRHTIDAALSLAALGDAARSRRPMLFGNRRPLVGLALISSRSSAWRNTTRAEMTMLRTLEPDSPWPTRRRRVMMGLASSWTPSRSLAGRGEAQQRWLLL
jgi:hypothetical protein